MMTSRRPILVTGSHRSGTSWVGKMIAASPNVEYVYEPLRPDHDYGICRADFPYWFMYVCDRNSRSYFDALRNTVELKYDFLLSIKNNRNPDHIVRSLGRLLSFSAGRVRRRRALLKDPIAIFSAEWLQATFDMDVVVMVRHPAAFASSIKLLNLSHPFDHFIRQPLLMRDHLEAFRAEIEAFAGKEHDILDQAALLWRLIHSMILKYQADHPDWIFVRHEDISRSPVNGFREIYQRLDLPFDHLIEAKIRRHSFANMPRLGEYSGRDIKRKSLENIDLWKKRLSPEEVFRLRRQVDDIASQFYAANEW